MILVLDLVLPKEQRRNLGWVTAVGMGLVILLSWPARPVNGSTLVWGGMISHDWLSYTLKLLVIFGAGITALFAMDYEELGGRGEFYLLMIASTIGMAFMASAADLVMLYLAIESVSIPLYILAGFFVRDAQIHREWLQIPALRSNDLRYYAVWLQPAVWFLWYDCIISTSSSAWYWDRLLLDRVSNNDQLTAIALIGSLLLVLVGFGFKISAVPFHFWAPDVYEGAPTPVAGFLSTASKAAGFIVLIRFLIFVFPIGETQWPVILSALAVATMTLGNLIALTQRNIKRLLAYSSIAHAGYMLIGVAALVCIANHPGGRERDVGHHQRSVLPDRLSGD